MGGVALIALVCQLGFEADNVGFERAGCCDLGRERSGRECAERDGGADLRPALQHNLRLVQYVGWVFLCHFEVSFSMPSRACYVVLTECRGLLLPFFLDGRANFRRLCFLCQSTVLKMVTRIIQFETSTRGRWHGRSPGTRPARMEDDPAGATEDPSGTQADPAGMTDDPDRLAGRPYRHKG